MKMCNFVMCLFSPYIYYSMGLEKMLQRRIKAIANKEHVGCRVFRAYVFRYAYSHKWTYEGQSTSGKNVV